jgi:hypothetical protein
MFRQPFRVLITEAFETGTKSVVCCPSLVVQQELFAKDPVHQFVALRRQTLTCVNVITRWHSFLIII